MSFSPGLSPAPWLSTLLEWVNRIKGTFASGWVERRVCWQGLHRGMWLDVAERVQRVAYLGQISKLHTLTRTQMHPEEVKDRRRRQTGGTDRSQRQWVEKGVGPCRGVVRLDIVL